MDNPTLINMVASFLKGRDWDIRAQRRGDAVCVDLLATSPDGKLFSIELQTGSGPTHFAALAQAERTANDFADSEHQEVTPVLVTTQDVSTRLKAVADRVGVEVIEIPEPEAPDSPPVDEIVADVASQLTPRT